MTHRTHTPTTRAAAIADYRESGDSYRAVAARHGVSRAVLHTWVNPGKRRPRGWLLEQELALTGGRWVTVRGIQRWEPFVAPSKSGLSDRERRIEWEEAMFTEDEARDMHARYFNGCREPRTVVGERVYQRRKKRNSAARRSAA